MRHFHQIFRKRLADEVWCRMLGLADVQIDGSQAGCDLNSFEQLFELLKGVGLQAVEIGIQFTARLFIFDMRVTTQDFYTATLRRHTDV